MAYKGKRTQMDDAEHARNHELGTYKQRSKAYTILLQVN